MTHSLSQFGEYMAKMTSKHDFSSIATTGQSLIPLSPNHHPLPIFVLPCPSLPPFLPSTPHFPPSPFLHAFILVSTCIVEHQLLILHTRRPTTTLYITLKTKAPLCILSSSTVPLCLYATSQTVLLSLKYTSRFHHGQRDIHDLSPPKALAIHMYVRILPQFRRLNQQF